MHTLMVKTTTHFLQCPSFGGPDLLCPNHLKYSGSLVKKWICQICNHIIFLEAIPSVFKHGIIIPIYKGKGKILSTWPAIEESPSLLFYLKHSMLNRILLSLSDINIDPISDTNCLSEGCSLF